MTSTRSTVLTGQARIPVHEGDAATALVMFRVFAVPIDARFLQIRQEITHATPVCPVCRAPVVVGDMITTTMRNAVLFPNCFVHTACVDWTDLTSTACALRDDWHAAQRYAHWFSPWRDYVSR